MEFPGTIHSPKLSSGTGFVVRYEARTVTGQPAIVLVAPPPQDGALPLEAAHKALVALRQDGHSPGCPDVLDYRKTREGGTMLTLAVRGAPLAFSWPDEANEVDVLSMALQHATLLAALHEASFSGLQPDFEDLRWDAGHSLLTVLGWEWLRENGDGRQRDMEAAALLWIELLTGAAPPPFPPLTAETAWPAWQRVSLGTRRLLSSLLIEENPPATAARVQEGIEAILRNWQRPAAQLLSDGLTQLAREHFPAAMALFDLAARLDPHSVGSFRLQGAQESATKRFDRLINDVRIGSYYPTVDKFQQLAGGSGITGQERLRAWRWWAITDAAWRLAPGDTTEPAEDHESFVNPFIEALFAAERRQVKAALSRVQKALAELKEDQLAGSLQFLEEDLRGCLRVEEAVDMLSENPAMSVELFEQAVSDIAALPQGYRAVLVSQIGDPSMGLCQATQQRDHHDLVSRVINEAKAAFKAQKLPLAEQKWNEVLRLSDRQDPKRTDYRQHIRHVHLRARAVSAGVTANLELMDQGAILPVLDALSALRTAFPRDRWGTAQAKRWQQMLVSRLEEDPTGPAGAWLAKYWPKVSSVRDSLEQIAPGAMDAWQAEFISIQDDDLPRTPQRVAGRIQQIDEFLTSIGASRHWLESTSRAEDYHTLVQAASKSLTGLRGLTEAQSRLRAQFHAAVDSGVQPVAVLDEANQLALELFDEVDRSVSSLRATYLDQKVNDMKAVWHLAIDYADTAWRAGDGELASRLYSLVLENTDAPQGVHAFCQLAKQHVDNGYDLSSDSEIVGLAQASNLQPLGQKMPEVVPRDQVPGTADVDPQPIQPPIVADLMTALQDMRQWLADGCRLAERTSEELAELALARVLAATDVKYQCLQVVNLVQESQYYQATTLLKKFVENKGKLGELDKRCVDKHTKYLVSEREKRKETIRTIVALRLKDLEEGRPVSDDEMAHVEKELEVYEELMNFREVERLKRIWNNRPGIPSPSAC